MSLKSKGKKAGNKTVATQEQAKHNSKTREGTNQCNRQQMQVNHDGRTESGSRQETGDAGDTSTKQTNQQRVKGKHRQ